MDRLSPPDRFRTERLPRSVGRAFAAILLATALLAGITTAAEPDPRATDAEAAPTDVSSDGGSSDAAATDDAPTDAVGRIGQFFERGGALMWALLLVSMAGLTFAFERLVSLRRGSHLPPTLVDDTLDRIRADGVADARAALAGKDAALARCLDALLARAGATRREHEAVLDDEIGRVLWDLRRNVRPVGIVSSVAPLIGLLGTVLGMISAFQQAAEKGMENPANFAEGIYQALYTTAFGLSIAIPFLLLHHYLRGRADIIMREAEDQCIRFIIAFHDKTGTGDAAPAPASSPSTKRDAPPDTPTPSGASAETPPDASSDAPDEAAPDEAAPDEPEASS